jgi:hypothetical protein
MAVCAAVFGCAAVRQCMQQCEQQSVRQSVRQCVRTAVCAAVCGSALGGVQQRGSACVAVCTIVCAQCAHECASVRLVVYGSACGSVRRFPAVRQCAACAAVQQFAVYIDGSLNEARLELR